MSFSRHASRLALRTVLPFLPLVLTPLPAQSQQVQYAAKFMCGIPQLEARREAVKPGNYATAINIHNPDPANPVSFLKKAVLAMPQGFDRRPPSDFKQESLDPDFALEVDCQNIRDLLGGPPAPMFIKGFVVIVVPGATSDMLDVVGVYTAEPPPPAGGPPNGIALEVVPITPRFMIAGIPTTVAKGVPEKK